MLLDTKTFELPITGYYSVDGTLLKILKNTGTHISTPQTAELTEMYTISQKQERILEFWGVMWNQLKRTTEITII